MGATVLGFNRELDYRTIGMVCEHKGYPVLAAKDLDELLNLVAQPGTKVIMNANFGHRQTADITALQELYRAHRERIISGDLKVLCYALNLEALRSARELTGVVAMSVEDVNLDALEDFLKQ